MVALKPPMGWNTWNTFGENINEELITRSADVLVDSGLVGYGYDTVVIDDCWALRERSPEGKLVPDPEKFPHGMKYVADYVHSKGLKFGMYSCAGMLTCAGYPSSYDHEFTDAASFAEWGVDFLKYDFCYRTKFIPGDILYKRMANALANCGRDILFSACSWGADNTREWIGQTGATMWRTTGDIVDSWKSLFDLSMEAKKNIAFGGINRFPDMDMLIVGMHGNGHVGVAGCTDDEYRLHFSLWSLLGSPLMIGCDIREMDDASRAILTNKDVIAVNQDPAYWLPYDANFPDPWEKDTDLNPVYVRLLDNGDFAIGAFNFRDQELNSFQSNLPLERIGLPESTGKTLRAKELWTGEEFTVKNGIMLFGGLAPHSCKLYRAKVVDA